MHEKTILFAVLLAFSARATHAQRPDAANVGAKDKAGCRAQASALAKQPARFDETLATMERCAAIDPNDPEGYQMLAAFYWDKAYRDSSISAKQKDDYVSNALANADKALKLKPDFVDALVYKGLALRLKASATTDAKLRGQYLEQANALQQQSRALMDEKRYGDAATKAFVDKLEAGVKAGDAAAIGAAIDFDAMLEKAMRGEGSAALRAQFAQGVKASVDIARGLAQNASKGSYKFLRVVPGRDGNSPIFRLLQGDDIFNYHMFALRRGAGGSARAVDMLVFSNGEWLSESLRRGFLVDLANSGVQEQLKKLAGFENDFARSGAQLANVNKLQAAGQFKPALDALLLLPRSVQANKNMLIQRVYISQQVGTTEYQNAVDAFKREFPSDPALDMMLIGASVLRKEYDVALAAIARLDKAVGGDASLDFMRGNIAFLKGDRAAATAAFKQATLAEPTFVPAYEALLRLALDAKDYAEMSALFSALVTQARVSPADVEKLPAYAEWKRASEYRNSKPSAGVAGGVVGGVADSPVAPPPPAAPAAVRVGGQIKEPRRIASADPVYPAIAQSARVQGVVILECTIATDGTVSDVRVLRGIPLLDQAAIDAVKQWRYSQTLLNGVPVPVIMTVTVNFSLK